MASGKGSRPTGNRGPGGFETLGLKKGVHSTTGRGEAVQYLDKYSQKFFKKLVPYGSLPKKV